MRLTTLFLLLALPAAPVVAQDRGMNAFLNHGVLDRSSSLDLGLVRASGAGTVEVYLSHNGLSERPIGSEPVHAGVNDVHVNVGRAPQYDVVAMLRVNGDVVATRRFDIKAHRSGR